MPGVVARAQWQFGGDNVTDILLDFKFSHTYAFVNGVRWEAYAWQQKLAADNSS